MFSIGERRDKSLFCLIFSSLFLLFVNLFSSCSMFNEPVREYFDYYTNNAAIESVSIPKAIGTYNGMPVIDSSDNVEVYFTLRNPKNYRLNFYNEEIGGSVFPEPHVPPCQDSLNLCSAKQFFLKSELEDAEKDNGSRIYNQTIHLITNDDAKRELDPSYNFSMFINSYPLPVKNPLLQLSEDGDGTYILCFFTPETSGTVHEDINKIWINSASFDFDNGIVDGTGFSSSAPSLYPLENGGLKFSDFQVPQNYKACYYQTNIPLSEEEKLFNITLEDKYGFKTTSSISNKAKKLSKPKIVKLDNNDIQSGESSTANADTKLYTIKIFHDGTYDDGVERFPGTVKIYYTIQAEPNSGVFGGTDTLTGSANGSVTLNLERGKYTISAYAQKNYCVDSDENTVSNVNIKEIPVYYVAPDGTSGTGTENGSITKPFKRFADIWDNLDAADTPDGAVCKIFLKNNITNYYFNGSETYMLAVPSGADCAIFEISGYGETKKINLSGSENNAVLSVPSGTNVTFKDINITGGKMASGGENYSLIKNLGTLTLENCSITNNDCTGVASNNAITIKNCTVTGNKNGGVEATGTINLSGKVVISGNTAEDASDPSKIVNCNLSLLKKSTDDDDKIFSVEGLSSSSKIWIKKQTTPGTGDPKVLVESWPVGLGNPWDIFKSDSSDFFVDYNDEKTKVVLKKQGATVSVGGQESISFEAGTPEIDYYLFIVTKEISIKSWTLTCGSDLVPSNYYGVYQPANTQVKITTGSLQPGNYILTLNFEYNGNTYEVNLPVTK